MGTQIAAPSASTDPSKSVQGIIGRSNPKLPRAQQKTANDRAKAPKEAIDGY